MDFFADENNNVYRAAEILSVEPEINGKYDVVFKDLLSGRIRHGLTSAGGSASGFFSSAPRNFSEAHSAVFLNWKESSRNYTVSIRFAATFEDYVRLNRNGLYPAGCHLYKSAAPVLRKLDFSNKNTQKREKVINGQ